MPKFENYKLEMELEAQMPIIHFQYNQKGATVRATEMKPKLDKYLISLLGKDVSAVKKNPQYKKWFLDADSDSNNALNYKLQIVAKNKPVITDISNYPRMYFTYSTRKGQKTIEKYGIQSDIKIIIVCFIEELRNHIEKNLVNFFLVTNFGYCQHKGMGSYIPTEWMNGISSLGDNEKKAVAKAFKTKNSGIRCYVLEHNGSHEQKVKSIEAFVSDIKSKKESFVREKGYFKDFLGIHRTKTYVLRDGKTIKFARLNSPLYFKVVKNCIFVVAFDFPRNLGNVKQIIVKEKGREIKTNVNKRVPNNIQDFLYDFIVNKTKFKEVKVDE